MTTDDRRQTTSVRVTISELMLRGFDPQLRYEIGDAVERELARLIGEQGWRGEPTSAMRIDGGMFELDPGAPPKRIGTEIASAVYAACGGQGK